MKKLILFLVCLLSLNSNAYNYPTYSKWSVTPEVGLNRFDGDINQSLKNIFPSSVWGVTAGLNLEYKINHIWGISANGYYIPINANTGLNGVTRNIGSDIWTGGLNLTIDITHLILPYSLSKLTVNGSVGLGYSFYSYDLTPGLTADDMLHIKSPSPGIMPTFPVTEKYGLAVTLPISVYLKYNYSKHIDILAKMSYICFNKDNLEGIWTYKGVTNDKVGLATLGISYKFSPVKYPKKDRNLQSDINDLNKEIKSLKKKNISQDNKIDSLSAYILNRNNNLDGKHNVDTINLTDNEIPSIYFDFDKYELDDWALITICKVAKKMQDNPKLKLQIVGYCDYMGDIPYNFKLSDERVERTKKEMVKVWKIDGSRIQTDGRGKLNDPKIKYRPNRRCDFKFLK